MIRNGGSATGPSVVKLYSLSGYESRGRRSTNPSAVRPPEPPSPRAPEVSGSRFAVPDFPAAGGKDSRDLDAYLDVLRKKWGEVPAGILGRRHTADLLDLPQEELKTLWLAMHRETTSGDGFPVRGWYQLLYRDVLRGKKVLDVGSGLGLDSIAFARAGARVTFLDIVDTNQQVIRKLCSLFGIQDVQFLYMRTLDSLNDLPDGFDFIWCQGSMINAPFDYMRVESQALLRHLPVGGRWVELVYPKQRWEREGALPFDQWGERTDGPGTPWMEWYDIERWRARMYPAEFDPVLHFNFHNDDFCWFDLVRTK
jgi:SAM-dependent methyltransferase